MATATANFHVIKEKDGVTQCRVSLLYLAMATTGLLSPL